MMSSGRGLKILASLVVALALGAAAVALWIHRVADRKWAAAQERIQQLVAAHPPVLQPMPTTKLSKEIQIRFVGAIKEAARRLGTEREAMVREYETRKLLQASRGGEKTELLLADAEEFLDQLHQGARQCAATPSEFPPGWRIDWDLFTLRYMLNCCVFRARQARARNAPMEAAETILDSLQLARFWAASGKGENRIHALNATHRPLQELKELLEREPLSGEQLRRLEAELEPLGAAIQRPTELLVPALARWTEGLESWTLADLSGAPYRWRYFLPRHLMKADAFEVYERHLHRLLEADHKPYADRLRDLEKAMEEAEESKNPILLREGPFSGLLGLTTEERMAQFRLFRMAARYRAAGEVLKLKDPFGQEILQSRSESRMKFWSVGIDGTDNGGKEPGDIVIEVEHPRPE